MMNRNGREQTCWKHIKIAQSATLHTLPATTHASTPKAQPPILDELETRVLEHLRKPSTKRPGNKQKLVSYLVGYLGLKISEADALKLIEYLSQAGHIVLDEKGKATYFLEQK
jgi:hypothetical protein